MSMRWADSDSSEDEEDIVQEEQTPQVYEENAVTTIEVADQVSNWNLVDDSHDLQLLAD